MIFNIVFGIWVVFLFGTIQAIGNEKNVTEIKAASYLIMLSIESIVLTIMAITSKFT